jgi:L-threonylcarbamoyladenylate synthase
MTNAAKTYPAIIGEHDLNRAVAVLAEGGVIAYPTETVYGLGGAISRREASDRIFAIKGRESTRTLSYMVNSLQLALHLSRDLSQIAVALMERFWPGPLTLVVNAAAGLPEHAVADNGTIGLRWPDHPVCHELVAQLGEAVSTTSANASGQPPLLSAGEVHDVLINGPDLIIDGGRCAVGVPSTVIRIVNGKPELLREGAIPFEEIINNTG